MLKAYLKQFLILSTPKKAFEKRVKNVFLKNILKSV